MSDLPIMMCPQNDCCSCEYFKDKFRSFVNYLWLLSINEITVIISKPFIHNLSHQYNTEYAFNSLTHGNIVGGPLQDHFTIFALAVLLSVQNNTFECFHKGAQRRDANTAVIVSFTLMCTFDKSHCQST